MRDAFTDVQHQARCAARRVECERGLSGGAGRVGERLEAGSPARGNPSPRACLDANVDGGGVKVLEEHLSALLAVARRVQWRLREQDLSATNARLSRGPAPCHIAPPLTGWSFAFAPIPSNANRHTRCMSSQSCTTPRSIGNDSDNAPRCSVSVGPTNLRAEGERMGQAVRTR